MFQGSLTALVTPFMGDVVDEAAFQRFVAWQIEQGTEGVIPCGSTGEAATLTDAEHTRVIEMALEVAKGKIPVIAGTGTNSTATTIAKTKKAKELGADAALIVAPYYNKPTQEGLYHHYKAVNDAVDIPLLIYNVPGRSIVDISIATMERLSKLKNVVGVKDATGDITRPIKTRNSIGENFCQLTGEDAITVPFMLQGGHGCISVTSNIAPKLCRQVQDAWRKRDLPEMMRLNQIMMPLHDAMFCETNPGPVKYGFELLGHGSSKARGPLWDISDESKARVKKVMQSLGLI